MGKKLISITIIVLGLISAARCQNSDKAKKAIARVNDDRIGISFEKLGKVEKVDSSTYRIRLLSTDKSAFAEVSVTARAFVDLPGSYGGKLYLSRSRTNRLLKSRVLVDTVNTGTLNFTREYWAVYAGMGMWEGVINCYVREGGRYYTVSLIQDKPIGKPGEVIGGKRLTAQELRGMLLASLQDTTNVIVRKFNKLLVSLQIHNQ